MKLVNDGDPTSNDFQTGPAIGTTVPDFSLKNQFGKTINYADYRGSDQALILFHRSASW